MISVDEDGAWIDQGDQESVECTAMAVSCLLGRPGGVREGDQPVVDKALAFLVSQVKPDGFVEGVRTQNYALAVFVQALAAAGRADLKPVMERCVTTLRSCQIVDEKAPSYGGMGYVAGVVPARDPSRIDGGAPLAEGAPRSPVQPTSTADLSNTVYALASLRAAGVKEDDPVFQRALKFLERVQNRQENETPGEPTGWKDKEGRKVVRSDYGGSAYSPGCSIAGNDVRPDARRRSGATAP